MSNFPTDGEQTGLDEYNFTAPMITFTQLNDSLVSKGAFTFARRSDELVWDYRLANNTRGDSMILRFFDKYTGQEVFRRSLDGLYDVSSNKAVPNTVFAALVAIFNV